LAVIGRRAVKDGLPARGHGSDRGKRQACKPVTTEAACGCCQSPGAGSRKLLPGTLYLTKHQAPSTKHQAPSTKLGFKTGSPGRDRLTGPSIPSFQYSFTSYTVSQYHIYSTISSKYSLLVRIIPVELTPIPTGMK
jgi:hypothetical protein